jgi:hypothetical protein
MAEQRAERRLAAILAGDVAGYSKLMGADEGDTLIRLNTIGANFSTPRSANTEDALLSGNCAIAWLLNSRLRGPTW